MLPLQIYWNVYRWWGIRSFSAKLGSLQLLGHHSSPPTPIFPISNTTENPYCQQNWDYHQDWDHPPWLNIFICPELEAWELYWVLWIFLDITIHHNILNFEHHRNLDHQQNWDYHQKLRLFTPVFFKGFCDVAKVAII